MKKDKKSFYLLLFFLWLTGCQSLPNRSFQSLLQSQPYLTELSPNPATKMEKIEKVELTFSEPIDATSVSEKTIFILNQEIDLLQYSDQALIEKDLTKGKLNRVIGRFEVDTNLQKISWSPSEILKNGNYTLVITSHVRGLTKIPFNQKPGEEPTPLMITFKLPKKQDSSETPNNPPSTEPLPSPKQRAEKLVINEILYDAAESDTDGNEFIELYGTPNADLDGYQVVLVNGEDGKVQKIITLPENSKIGEDGIFLIADAQTGKPSQSYVLDANFIDNFDPQNGPDAVQLLDDHGNLIDALSYGAVKATQASNGLSILEGATALDIPEGHTLSRIQGLDTNDNKTDFIDLEKPTPGVL